MNGSRSQAGCFWLLLVAPSALMLRLPIPRIALAPQPYPTRTPPLASTPTLNALELQGGP